MRYDPSCTLFFPFVVKIVISCELQRLPAPRIELYEESTKFTLFSEVPFTNLSIEDKLWACYIRYLISTGGRNLPKKRRVIFEPQRPPRRQHNRKFDVPNINKAGC